MRSRCSHGAPAAGCSSTVCVGVDPRAAPRRHPSPPPRPRTVSRRGTAAPPGRTRRPMPASRSSSPAHDGACRRRLVDARAAAAQRLDADREAAARDRARPASGPPPARRRGRAPCADRDSPAPACTRPPLGRRPEAAQGGVAGAADVLLVLHDLVAVDAVGAHHIGEELDDALQLLGDDPIDADRGQRLDLGDVGGAHQDAHGRVDRARHRGDAARGAGVVVGDDQELGVIGADELQGVQLGRVAAQHRQTVALGLVGAGRIERRDDVGDVRAVQHPHQPARGVAVAGDDDVVLEPRVLGRLGRRLLDAHLFELADAAAEGDAERGEQRRRAPSGARWRR